MEFESYQSVAERTAIQGLNEEQDLCYLALGLSGESGEFADIIKKHVFHGHPLDLANAEEELGDVLWYLANCATKLGLSLNNIARANIEKLHRRYPDGFSQEASLNRQQSEQ